MQDLSNLVVYNDGELELKVSVDSETIWLTQKQIAEVFGGTKQNISLHINNIYKEKELDKIKGKNTDEIEPILGYKNYNEIIKSENIGIIKK